MGFCRCASVVFLLAGALASKTQESNTPKRTKPQTRAATTTTADKLTAYVCVCVCVRVRVWVGGVDGRAH